jgi:hypothetical protein
MCSLSCFSWTYKYARSSAPAIAIACWLCAFHIPEKHIAALCTTCVLPFQKRTTCVARPIFFVQRPSRSVLGHSKSCSEISTVFEFRGMCMIPEAVSFLQKKRILYSSTLEEMVPPQLSYKLSDATTASRSEPDYFKPLPATPSTESAPTSPVLRFPEQHWRKRAASDSSWRPPADWTNDTESLTGSPQLWTCYRPRNYSPLIPEPLPTSVSVRMEPAPWRADIDSARKRFLSVSAERPLPSLPEIPRRNPSRVFLPEHPSQKNSPRSTERSESSSQSDVSLIEGLSKVIPESPPEHSKQDSALNPSSPLKSLRILPTEEEQTASSDISDESLERTLDSDQVDNGHDIMDRPQTGDRGLIPQPLSWRKASSGSYFPDDLYACSQPPSSVDPGQSDGRKRLRSWIPRNSSGHSRQPEEKSQNHQIFSKTSTESSQRDSSSAANNGLLTHVVQCGKDFWLHIRRTGATSTEQQNQDSSYCPVRSDESLVAPPCETKRSNVLLRLPGGFALVRQSSLSASTTNVTSGCSIPQKLQSPENDTYMVSEILDLEPPPMRTSWATHESEVTATSTRAIHSCSRISFGSVRSPESRSGSNIHLASPSPLTQEILLPCDSPSQLQPLRPSSSSSAPTTETYQRVDSVVGRSSPKQGLVSSAKSAWNSWKVR